MYKLNIALYTDLSLDFIVPVSHRLGTEMKSFRDLPG